MVHLGNIYIYTGSKWSIWVIYKYVNTTSERVKTNTPRRKHARCMLVPHPPTWGGGGRKDTTNLITLDK